MIASLTNTELEKIASATSQSEKPGSDRDYLGACVRAMMDIDSTRLEDELSKAVLVLGIDRFLEEVVVPFLHELDKGWEQQSISIAQEHLASALLRTQLDRVRLSIHVPASAPRILVTTPSGQIHEIGALLAAIFAARQGWNVTYLGPNLPAEEIAIAAAKTHSKAVGLSLVYPENDPLVKSELIKIRQHNYGYKNHIDASYLFHAVCTDSCVQSAFMGRFAALACHGIRACRHRNERYARCQSQRLFSK